jgi:hypothetical protein
LHHSALIERQIRNVCFQMYYILNVLLNTVLVFGTRHREFANPGLFNSALQELTIEAEFMDEASPDEFIQMKRMSDPDAVS